MKHFLFMTLLLPMTALASPTFAADGEVAPRRWADRYDHYGTRTVAPARRAGTAVYGWSYRAPTYGSAPVAYGNCGLFRYWDGNQCLDARDNPPPLQ